MFTRCLFSVLILFITIISFGQNYYFGSDYYPEHFPLKDVGRDASLMKAAGLNTVRMGDFAWVKMQPNNHTFALDWLVNTVDTLGKYNIKTLLCTPTAAIPKWMFDQYPDIMQVTETGQRKPYGKRRHACLNNETYRQFSEGIAIQMTKAMVNNPNVIGFQIDNELMAEEPYCYCEICRLKFADWLQKKYKTVEALNNEWGLTFWSENLSSFNQVFIPRKGDNPGCFLDYQDFYSDCTIDFFNLQRNAIKKIAPHFKVTHNICSSGFLYKLDQYKLAKTCDFLSFDNYPYTWTLENEYAPIDNFDFHPAMASMALSQCRGTLHIPFWVTESQISRTAGKQRKMIEPGKVRLWSHQELSHGANATLFFPYRTFVNAHEQMMNGILDADNIQRRRYEEVKQTSQELFKIKNIIGNAFPDAKAAVIRDFKCDWAFEDGRISADFRYMRHIYSYYKALREHSITTDIVSPNDNLLKYPLIIVPAQVLMTPELSSQLKIAAESGTTVVITCMTGLRDSTMKSFGGMINKDIEALTGIEMQEQFALIKLENTKISLKSNPTKEYSGGLWYDVFNPLKTEVLANYESRFLKGKPVIVRHKVGKGMVYYMGTIPSDELISDVLPKILSDAAIIPLAKAKDKLVDITELKGKKKYVYAINFSDTEQMIELSFPMKDIITNEKVSKQTSIKEMDMRVFEVE